MNEIAQDSKRQHRDRNRSTLLTMNRYLQTPDDTDGDKQFHT